jgi:hypothetical protein
VFNFGEIDEGLLGERSIGADPDHLSILCRELGVVVVRAGRLKMFDSCWAEVQDIEIDQDILAF